MAPQSNALPKENAVVVIVVDAAAVVALRNATCSEKECTSSRNVGDVEPDVATEMNPNNEIVAGLVVVPAVGDRG